MSEAPEGSVGTEGVQDADELDAALTAAERLGDSPLPEHAEAFERVHELLHRRLEDTR